MARFALAWQKPDNVAGSAAPALMIGLFAAFGGILFGYDTGTISGIIAMKWWIGQFGTGYINAEGNADVSPLQTAEIVSILSAGTFFGALMAAPFADHIGRRRGMILAVCIFTFGCVLQTAAMQIPLFVAGRFFAGYGVGLISVLVPCYLSEMAPKWIRGALVCAYQLAITTGLLIAAVVTYATSDFGGPSAFRIPVAIQFVWAGMLLVGLVFLPETPRYLIKCNDHAGAAASLSRIRRLDITHPALVEEIAEIEANHAYEISLGASTYRDVFAGAPHLGRRLLTGCGLQMLQQLTGCNYIFYYGTTFFTVNKIGSGFLFQVISNSINMLSTFPGMVLVESWGRRTLLMSGAAGMAVCQLIVAAIGTIIDTNGHDSVALAANKAMAAFVFLYIFFFAVSWGPVAWVVTSEIYPLKIRAKSMSVSTASNWLINWIIAFTSPFIVSKGEGYAGLGPKVFYVWGGFCIVAFFFVYLMVYETSRISLEQIDELYERVDRAWKSKNFEPNWSFQDIREETTEEGHTSGISLADREEARRRAGMATTNHSGDEGSELTIYSSGTNSQDSSERKDTVEDKIIADLGHVDFTY